MAYSSLGIWTFLSHSFQDSSLVIFRDHSPGTQEHLLVIPVRHIRDCASLLRASLYLLISDSMQQTSRHCDVQMSFVLTLASLSHLRIGVPSTLPLARENSPTIL